MLLGFAVLTVLVAASWLIGAARPPFAGAMALMLAGLAYRYVPVAPAAAGAVLVTLGTMLFWPLAREAGAEPRNRSPTCSAPRRVRRRSRPISISRPGSPR